MSSCSPARTSSSRTEFASGSSGSGARFGVTALNSQTTCLTPSVSVLQPWHREGEFALDEQPNRSDAADRTVVDEMRELGQSLSALGRTAFKGGRVLSVEVLRSVRAIVDKAKDEIDRMAAADKKPPE